MVDKQGEKKAHNSSKPSPSIQSDLKWPEDGNKEYLDDDDIFKVALDEGFEKK